MNIQSLFNKIDAVEVLLSVQQPDILCLTETWLPEDAIQSMNIPGYIIAAYYCRKDKRHGGTIIYCKDNYTPNVVSYIEKYNIETHIECAAIEINVQDVKINILSAYRPPAGEATIFFSHLSAILTKLYSKNSYLVVCGDFNIDGLSTCMNKLILYDLFDSFGLNNKFQEPTRIATNKNNIISKTALDYIVTNIASKYFSSKIINPSLSDHLAQHLSLDILSTCPEQSHTTSKFSRTINTTNLITLKNLLKEETWENIYTNDVNSAFQNFIETLLCQLDVAAPIKPFRKKSNHVKPWITPEIKLRGQELKDLFKLSKNAPTKEMSPLYSKKKKEYRKLVSVSKSVYYRRNIEDSTNKSRQIWNIINNNIKAKQTKEVSKLCTEQGIITDIKEIANQFGNYFATTVEESLKSHFDTNLSQRCTTAKNVPNSMYFCDVSETEIKSVIENLNNKKSSGADGISTKIIKFVHSEILRPLVYLVNLSVSTGIFPECLKRAIVIPIHKKGDPSLVENYRPISLLSIFSKILEKIVHCRIMNYVTSFNILANSQHGFQSGRSTETASFHLVNFVNKALDNKKCTAAVFYDLSKAFDSVKHSFVEDKLHSLGIRGNILKWIMSFLKNRRLSVRIKDTLSETYTIDVGVAQGSVLGPLIFLLFVNDLPNNITSGFPVNFADDTTVGISADNEFELDRKIKNVSSEVQTWCDKNMLMLNKSKTVIVYFNRLTPEHHTTFLGTLIDNRLAWCEQIDIVCKKLNKAFYAILKMKENVDKGVIKIMYYALAYSHMSYNVMLWGRASKAIRVFVAQKKIIRLMYNMKPRQSCREIFKKENILTFPSIFIYKCAVFSFLNPDLFEQNKTYHTYNTRSCTDFRITLHSTSQFERSPSYSCIKIFNCLPVEIKNTNSVYTFKKKLKLYLLQNSFYSIDEFLQL